MITDQEREKVQTFFEKAKREKRLVEMDVWELDVLYPYAQWPAVLRVKTEKGIELWACQLDDSFQAVGAIQAGTQDAFGNNLWKLQ